MNTKGRKPLYATEEELVLLQEKHSCNRKRALVVASENHRRQLLGLPLVKANNRAKEDQIVLDPTEPKPEKIIIRKANLQKYELWQRNEHGWLKVFPHGGQLIPFIRTI